MAKYIPGQLIDELTKSFEPVRGISWCYENGLLQGEYVVARQPNAELGPKIEKIRQAAYNHWQDEVFDFDDIFQWVKNGGKDPLTQETTINTSASIEATLALIDNNIFLRPFDHMYLKSKKLEDISLDSIV